MRQTNGRSRRDECAKQKRWTCYAARTCEVRNKWKLYASRYCEITRSGAVCAERVCDTKKSSGGALGIARMQANTGGRFKHIARTRYTRLGGLSTMSMRDNRAADAQVLGIHGCGVGGCRCVRHRRGRPQPEPCNGADCKTNLRPSVPGGAFAVAAAAVVVVGRI